MHLVLVSIRYTGWMLLKLDWLHKSKHLHWRSEWLFTSYLTKNTNGWNVYPPGNDHISHQTGKGTSSTQKYILKLRGIWGYVSSQEGIFILKSVFVLEVDSSQVFFRCSTSFSRRRICQSSVIRSPKSLRQGTVLTRGWGWGHWTQTFQKLGTT